MKKVFAVILLISMLLCVFSACSDSKKTDDETKENYGKIFYVSENGSDENDGSKSSPLASVKGAVDKLETFITENGLPDNGIKIEFAEGVYTILDTINISDRLSGEDGKPIVFSAEKGSQVIFDGGVVLNNTDFKPVTDENVLSLLKTDEARENILCLDLSMPEYSVLFKDGSDAFLQTLSSDGDIQTIARWPNNQAHASAEIIENEGDYSNIAITEQQAESWAKSDTIGWFGYGQYDWKESIVHNGISIDMEKNAICIPNNQISYAPVDEEMPFYVFDLLCELDEPGEYYRDNENKILYYWPSKDISNAKITINANPEYGINIENAEYLTIENIIFENYCATPINVHTNYFSLLGCTIRCCGDYAVITSGKHNTFNGNTMYNLSSGGIYITGGDFETMEIADVSIINNHIYHFALIERTYRPAIKISGVGFYIAHNEIHDTPHNAIQGSMALTIIEYNEIYDAVTMSSDAGAIYAGRNWINKGTVIRYNYFHDIQDKLFGGYPLAVYYDDCLAMQECYSNIFVNVAGNAIGASGKNIIAYNNICANTGGIMIDGRGYKWYPSDIAYPEGTNWKNTMINAYLSNIWIYSTPELVSVLEMKEPDNLKGLRGLSGDMLDSPGTPSYATIVGNIGYNSGSITVGIIDYFIENIYTEKNEDEEEKIVEPVYTFGTVFNNLDYTNNYDDVFTDAGNGNFFLKNDSKVYRDIIGFEQWDYNLIGIQNK